MSVVPKFWYHDVVFDGKLLWGALHSAEMLYTYKLFAICGKGILKNTPGCNVNFVQETNSFRFGVYGGIAFDRMAATHMLKLKRIQYRCLWIAHGLMQSTHVQTVEVIGGVPLLRMRFSMLSHLDLVDISFEGCMSFCRG
jgi:hypothetical protein